MIPSFSVTDPLAAREVTLILTLPAADSPRAERPVLLSLGAVGEAPLTRRGTLGELADLVDRTWRAYGGRAQLAAAAANDAAAGAETLARADVAPDETTAGDVDSTAAAAPAPAAKPKDTPPRPAAGNLSLF